MLGWLSARFGGGGMTSGLCCVGRAGNICAMFANHCACNSGSANGGSNGFSPAAPSGSVAKLFNRLKPGGRAFKVAAKLNRLL